MEHRHIEDLARVADIHPDPVRIKPALKSRKERLERWAVVLESHGLRKLNALPEIEYMPRRDRPGAQYHNSVLTVAFNDPDLRAAGLTGETFGEARRFFGLSEHRMHELVCNCAISASISGARMADRVRKEADRKPVVGWTILAAVTGTAAGMLYTGILPF